jgi:hypothetical protein
VVAMSIKTKTPIQRRMSVASTSGRVSQWIATIA